MTERSGINNLNPKESEQDGPKSFILTTQHVYEVFKIFHPDISEEEFNAKTETETFDTGVGEFTLHCSPEGEKKLELPVETLKNCFAVSGEEVNEALFEAQAELLRYLSEEITNSLDTLRTPFALLKKALATPAQANLIPQMMKKITKGLSLFVQDVSAFGEVVPSINNVLPFAQEQAELKRKHFTSGLGADDWRRSEEVRALESKSDEINEKFKAPEDHTIRGQELTKVQLEKYELEKQTYPIGSMAEKFEEAYNKVIDSLRDFSEVVSVNLELFDPGEGSIPAGYLDPTMKSQIHEQLSKLVSGIQNWESLDKAA